MEHVPPGLRPLGCESVQVTIDMHPGLAALVMVILAWFVNRATRTPTPKYNPDDFKE